MGKVFYYDWRWSLKSSVDELWDLVSDTHNFNRVTGLPKMRFDEIPQADGSVRRIMKARMYGFFPMEWEEFTFEWIKPLRFGSMRAYKFPFPMKSLKTLTHLQPRSDGGTDIQYEVWAEAQGLIGLPAVPFGVGIQSKLLFGRAFRYIDDFIQQIKPRPFPTPNVELSHEGFDRYQKLMREIIPRHDPALVSQFEQHLIGSPVEEITRMRPYQFAQRWNADRNAVLGLFLHAASIGLLDLSWDILCPECRGAKYKTATLADLADTVHCPSCNIDYTADFEQSVEATFALNSTIAPDAVRSEYCIGGPQTMPHVLVQQLLHPSESRSTTLPLQPGTYRLRAPRLRGTEIRSPAAILAPIPGQTWLTANRESDQTEFDIEISDEGLTISVDQVRSGEITFHMHNQTQSEQVLIVEDGSWSNQLATAADVTALQVFRDLFSSQALRPGYTVSIQNMVVLFSDLKDSTVLYRRIGDASAFGQVIDHFSLLKNSIAAQNGALVKTIGDAVMAVFRDPAAGLRAALDMLEKIEEYNTTQPDDGRLCLKIGLHQGACIAVNLNDRLDYFGSTVNIAARLVGQCVGDEVITSQAIMDDPGVWQYLKANYLYYEPFVAVLKGFEDNHRLYRVRSL